MARVKLTEHRAKTILIGSGYRGISIKKNSIDADIEKLHPDESYIIKVDQGIKKRGKQGLIRLNVKKDQAKQAILELQEKGFDSFVAEPMFQHQEDEEQYVSFERTRQGFLVNYSPKGGVDIEDNPDSIQSFVYVPEANTLTHQTPLSLEFISHVAGEMDRSHLSFVEINPLVVRNSEAYLLDAAVLADSAGEYFVSSWSEADVVDSRTMTDEETAVAELNENSPATFSLRVLNPNGSLWLLLSGGGASITIADEAQNFGRGVDLGNYGEYSGGTSSEETYLYAKQVLSLALKSSATKKAIVIAGGVANFSDVKKTFSGIVKALKERQDELKQAGIRVFVRRGGPNEKEGLALMKNFLETADLFGSVHGSDAVLTAAASEAMEYTK
jgi:succinyl-CoA synthetase beta subunit